MKNFDLEKRRYVLSAIASLIIVVYIIRLFSLQIASDDYRKSADSNAFLKKDRVSLARHYHRPKRQTTGLQPTGLRHHGGHE